MILATFISRRENLSGDKTMVSSAFIQMTLRVRGEQRLLIRRIIKISRLEHGWSMYQEVENALRRCLHRNDGVKCAVSPKSASIPRNEMFLSSEHIPPLMSSYDYCNIDTSYMRKRTGGTGKTFAITCFASHQRQQSRSNEVSRHHRTDRKINRHTV